MEPFQTERADQLSSVDPKLDDYFVKFNIGRFLTRRQPYDFIETYHILRELFGYQTHYVNLGYWPLGPGTCEPGRELVTALAKLIPLDRGERVIEVGSGLGQAAVDLCRMYALADYIGLNNNARQVAFANALAHSQHVGTCVRHLHGDACYDLRRLGALACDVILAVECVGHFRDPDNFLSTAHNVLRKDGRLAMTLNVAKTRLKLPQRQLFYLSLGHAPSSLQTWIDRLRCAGFRNIKTVEWTNEVLVPGLHFALGALRQQRLSLHPIISRYVRLQFLTALHSTVHGELGYYAVTATA